VTTTGVCPWTAAANDAWIAISDGSSGAGSDTVAYSVASNGTTATRTGTLTVAGKTVTVTEAGQPCTYTVMPQMKTFDKMAHDDRINVSTTTGCAWTAVSDASWLTVDPATASGSGNGRVDYSTTPNDTGADRIANITIENRTVVITQRK